MSGICAGCERTIAEGEPFGLWYLRGVVPVRAKPALPVGLFCESCAPRTDPRYEEENF